MKFLVLGYDGKDEGALDRRMAVRADHFKNVQSIVVPLSRPLIKQI